MHKILLLSGLWTFTFGVGVVFGQGANLGKPINPADIAMWDSDVEPSGAGLPASSGTAEQGAPIFAEKCALCHGVGGKNVAHMQNGAALAPRPLVSDAERVGIDESTATIRNYWQYSTTLFDFIRRGMPWTAPGSLSDHEVYALTAYILAENKLIDAKQEMNAQTLPKVEMPNRNGFINRFPKLTPPG
jgi:cytochrome c